MGKFRIYELKFEITIILNKYFHNRVGGSDFMENSNLIFLIEPFPNNHDKLFLITSVEFLV